MSTRLSARRFRPPSVQRRAPGLIPLLSSRRASFPEARTPACIAGIHVASTSAKRLWLFRDHASRCRWGRRLFRRGDHECDPGVPAVGPVLVRELPITFEVEIALGRGAQGNNETELRAHANHARLEAADPIAGTTVATDLLIDIANGTDKKLFR